MAAKKTPKKKSVVKKPKALTKEQQEVRLLLQKHEMFCQFYVKNQATYGNATFSYAEAYGYNLDELPDDDAVYEQVYDANEGCSVNGKLIRQSSRALARRTCEMAGSRLMRNDKIQERIIELRNELLRDDVVDSKLADHILQDEDRSVSLAAVKEFNKLRRRTANIIELSGFVGGPAPVDERRKNVLDTLLKKNALT